METVDQREWIVRSIHDDVVAMEQPDGRETRVRRSLLPDDIEPGDRFRVVAQVDRRTAEAASPQLLELTGS